MPIVFAQPQPVPVATVANQSPGRRGRRGGAGFADGVTFVPGAAPAYDTGIQDAISGRDRQSLDAWRLGNEFSVSTRDDFAAQSSLGQQRERFRLEAELNQVQLTQSERLRLQRVQNAIGEVNSDPNYSDEEKAEIIAQLKGHASPLQMRLARERIAQESVAKEALVEQRRMNAALSLEELRVASSKFEERTNYFIEPQVLASIVEDFKANTPMADRLPPKLFEEMARQEAIRQGLGTTYYQESPNKWTPISGGMAAGAARTPTGERPGGEGASAAESPEGYGIGPKDYARILDDTISSVDKKLSETVDDPSSGGRKFANPELRTPQGRAAALKSELEFRLNAMREFNRSSQTGRQGGKGYVSPFSKARAPEAPPAVEPTPGTSAAPPPVKLTEQGRARQVARFDEQWQSLESSPRLSADEKSAARYALARARELADRYPSSEAAPPEVIQEMRRLQSTFKELKAKSSVNNPAEPLPEEFSTPRP